MITLTVTEDEAQLLMNYRASSQEGRGAVFRAAEATAEYQQAVDIHGEVGVLLAQMLSNPGMCLHAEHWQLVRKYLCAAKQQMLQA